MRSDSRMSATSSNNLTMWPHLYHCFCAKINKQIKKLHLHLYLHLYLHWHLHSHSHSHLDKSVLFIVSLGGFIWTIQLQQWPPGCTAQRSAPQNKRPTRKAKMATRRTRTGGAPYCPLNRSAHSLGSLEFGDAAAEVELVVASYNQKKQSVKQVSANQRNNQ